VALGDDKTRRRYVLSHLALFLPPAIKQTVTFNWKAFVVNRSLWVYALDNSNDCDTAQNQTAVTAAVNQTKAFLDSEIGAPPDNGFDARTPAMLDLDDACRTEAAQTTADVAQKSSDALIWRAKRIVKITLRALALNNDFWGTNNTLIADALREYLDRRMRIVEMMNFHVNPVTSVSREWVISGTAPNTPVWLDGYRNRLFEYPQLNVGVSGRLAELIDRAPAEAIRLNEVNTSKHYEPQPQTAAGQWDWLLARDSDGPTRMVWDHKPPFPETLPPLSAADAADVAPAKAEEANVRLPTPQERLQWRLSRKDLYTLLFYTDSANPMTFVQAIERLFRLRDNAGADTRLNFYDRNWFNCDHVIAALQYEALLLAWRRRVTPAQVAHAESVLNQLANAGPQLGALETRYAWLGAMVRETQGINGALLDGRNNPLFRTRHVPLEQIEIGDHVIFSNNEMYDSLEGGLMRLENAVVMGFDENEDGTVVRKSVVLAGHGMEGTPANYTDEFASEMQTQVTLALAEIKKWLATHANGTRVPLLLCEAVKWTPYPELRAGPTDSPSDKGAWWLVYPLGKEKAKGRHAITAEAVVELPGSVGIGKNSANQNCILMSGRTGPLSPMTLLQIPLASDFTPFNSVFPDLAVDKFILLPLTQPKMTRKANEKATPSWARYFKGRTSPTTKPRTLEVVSFDSTVIPGFVSPTGNIWSNGPRPRVTLP
jgi:hypothetical protein